MPLRHAEEAEEEAQHRPHLHTLSGTVTGAVLRNVLITLSGAGSATTLTNASGNYSFSGLANGSYTATPSLAGYTFSPTSNAVTISGANATVSNFVSMAALRVCSLTAAPSTIAMGGSSTLTLSCSPDITCYSYSGTDLRDGGWCILIATPTTTGIHSYTVTGSDYDATSDTCGGNPATAMATVTVQ